MKLYHYIPKDNTIKTDGLLAEYDQDFMLFYNFPPFSVGECGRLGTPGRREIGHGKLAWRAIHPMLPKDKDVFPYTIRVVSDIMESNGSSFIIFIKPHLPRSRIF